MASLTRVPRPAASAERPAPALPDLRRTKNSRPRRRDLSPKASVWALAALIGLSGVARGLAAQKVQSPWILPDELVYSELARSFAMTGHFALRGVHTTAYSVGYPVLLSSAFFHRSPAAAYDAAKWLNAFLMSLAAIPIFFLARRLLPNWLSLLVASLALLLPSLAYTGVLMTENAFYPVFLTAILVIVRVLERPTVARQCVAMAVIAVGFLMRAQGIVLMPALVLAIVLLALSSADRDGSRSAFRASLRRDLRHYRFTLAVVVVGAASLWTEQIVRGRSISALLGIYAGTVHSYSATAVLRWIAYHLVDLELYLGVLPFVPATVAATALLCRKGLVRGERAVAAASIAAVTCLLILVATISSQPMSAAPGNPPVPTAVHDRYLFYIAPLYLLFFVYWLHRRRDFSNRVMAPLIAVSVLLPLTLPFADVHTNADFEALALLPWKNSLVAEQHVPLAMTVTACVFSVLLFIRRSSFAMLQVGLVAVTLFFMGQIAHTELISASVKVASSYSRAPAWIDSAVPKGAQVAVLWRREPRWSAVRALGREQALWKAEFFNSSVKLFFYLGRRMHYDLPQARARVRDRQLLRPGSDRSYRYVLAASPLELAGTVVARDPKAGLVLYRLRDGA